MKLSRVGTDINARVRVYSTLTRVWVLYNANVPLAKGAAA